MKRLDIGFQFQKHAIFENGIKGFSTKRLPGTPLFRGRCGGEVLQARVGGNGVRFRLAHDG
jgi:hypothetical protein